MVLRSCLVWAAPLTACALGVTVLVAACGGASTTLGPGSGPATDASTGVDGATPPGDDGATPATDAAPVDGEVITEGGSNPDLDGGDDAGIDRSPDGALCNTLDNNGGTVLSTCASTAPNLRGGALVAGTYLLTAVTAYAPAAFCKGGFIPVGFKETAVLAVASGVATADTVTLLANNERRTTVTLTPGAGNTSPLTADDLCPSGDPPVQVDYEVATDAASAKTVMVLRLAYAKDSADYRFELQ